MSSHSPSLARSTRRSVRGRTGRRTVFVALLAAALAAPGKDSGPVAQQGFQPSQKIKADTVVDFPVDI